MRPDKQIVCMMSGWPIHCFKYPVQVYPGLWLSGVGFDTDIPTWCKRNNIQFILNTAGAFGQSFYEKSPTRLNITYKEIEITDDSDAVLHPYLEETYEFIKNAQEKQEHILVHCIWGQSRSVSFIIYFLMKEHKLTYDEALSKIRLSKPEAYPNENFEEELRKL